MLLEISSGHNYFSFFWLFVNGNDSALCYHNRIFVKLSQSYIVSLFSMLLFILCKNLAVIRKILPSLWPSLLFGQSSWARKANLFTVGKKIGKSSIAGACWQNNSKLTLRVAENGHTLLGISPCPTVLHPAGNARKMLPVPRSLLQLSLKTD